MSHVAKPRNQTTTPPGAAHPLRGQPPLRHGRSAPELRASQPTGPLEYDHLDGHVAREAPELDDALEVEVDFGKFHGHTLGEIAAFEPSYIDWLAGTQMREPELALAARVIVAGAGSAGDPAGASAAAQGLALQPVPLRSAVNGLHPRRYDRGCTSARFVMSAAAPRRPGLMAGAQLFGS